MPLQDYLRLRFPTLGEQLPRTRLASLPTALTQASTRFAGVERRLLVKRDDQTGSIYGGNKVRKLASIVSLWQSVDRPELGREIAGPDEARDILGLSGAST